MSNSDAGTPAPSTRRRLRRRPAIATLDAVAKGSVLRAAVFASGLQAAASWSTSPPAILSSVPRSPPWLSIRSVPPSFHLHLAVRPPDIQNFRAQVKRGTIICRLSSHGVVVDRSELEVLTVKELRQRITDWGLASRGLSGKRKAELIDYMVDSAKDKLSQTSNKAASLVNENDGNADVEEEAPPKQMTKMRGTTMPPMPMTAALNGLKREIIGSHSIMKNDEKEINPAKEKVYRYVLKQYPPLHDFINPDTLEHVDSTGGTKPEGLGEHDIRQAHHPMLKGMRYSDLDVVFVGTASCTPGMTRGVSCTALRLQWRRKSTNLGTKGKDRNKKGANSDTDTSTILGPDGRYSTSGSFSGGGQGPGSTWLFDCGESTQVSCLQLRDYTGLVVFWLVHKKWS